MLLVKAMCLCRNQNTAIWCFELTQTKYRCVCVLKCFAKGGVFGNCSDFSPFPYFGPDFGSLRSR